MKLIRREEIMLNGVQSGHTYLTERHLMEGDGVQVPPICPFCDNALITVKHLLLVCPALDEEQRLYKV